MLESNEGALFYDLSEEVVCRCGQPVVIKKVTDQWFIDYANQKFTDMTKEHAKSMHILPNDYYTNVQPVLDWFRERACVRQGNWLAPGSRSTRSGSSRRYPTRRSIRYTI